jgi:polysaccharide pyruvyl transferase WcaK-like protein
MLAEASSNGCARGLFNLTDEDSTMETETAPALEPQPGRVIAVWGHYHGGNLGDDLVIATVIEAIRRREPDAQIIGISQSPGDTQRRHGIPAYPILPGASHAGARVRRPAPRSAVRQTARRIPLASSLYALVRRLRSIVREGPFVVQSYKLLRGVDLIVVAGSGPLHDDLHGAWGHPYRVFRWATLARLGRVPMVYASVGAGPIDRNLSAFFIRTALSWSSRISVRDHYSAELLQSLGVRKPLDIAPDMGWGLSERFVERDPDKHEAAAATPTVGLNVMAYADPRYWREGDPRVFETYTARMAEFARWLLDAGYRVRLFSSQIPSDQLVAEELVRLIDESGPYDPECLEWTFDRIENVEDLVDVIAGSDIVVAARFHSVLLPLLLGVPVLALSYHQKTSELLASVGRPEQILEIQEAELARLVGAFNALEATSTPAEAAMLAAQVEEKRQAVERQFDELFGQPLAPAGGRSTVAEKHD